MRVLVVEDEFVNRLFLQRLLSKYGQCDIAVYQRIRRSGNHLHIMAEIRQRTAQMPDVNTLAAAVGIAPVTD